jgi:hypothetical protein
MGTTPLLFGGDICSALEPGKLAWTGLPRLSKEISRRNCIVGGGSVPLIDRPLCCAPPACAAVARRSSTSTLALARSASKVLYQASLNLSWIPWEASWARFSPARARGEGDDSRGEGCVAGQSSEGNKKGDIESQSWPARR